MPNRSRQVKKLFDMVVQLNRAPLSVPTSDGAGGRRRLDPATVAKGHPALKQRQSSRIQELHSRRCREVQEYHLQAAHSIPIPRHGHHQRPLAASSQHNLSCRPFLSRGVKSARSLEARQHARQWALFSKEILDSREACNVEFHDTEVGARVQGDARVSSNLHSEHSAHFAAAPRPQPDANPGMSEKGQLRSPGGGNGACIPANGNLDRRFLHGNGMTHAAHSGHQQRQHRPASQKVPSPHLGVSATSRRVAQTELSSGELQPGWDSHPKDASALFPSKVWTASHKPPYVHIVDTPTEARRVMSLLDRLVADDECAAAAHPSAGTRPYASRRVFACDTEIGWETVEQGRGGGQLDAAGPACIDVLAEKPIRRFVQATDIDVTSQCPEGHGRVTCWSVYGGPDVDFSQPDLRPRHSTPPACVLYIDTFLSGTGDDSEVAEVLEIWDALRPFLESDRFPKGPLFPRREDPIGSLRDPCKTHSGGWSPCPQWLMFSCVYWMLMVWHNYGFDRHILQRHGLGLDADALQRLGRDATAMTLRVRGFAADTIHMARLHNAGRKGGLTYSLASLTSDKNVMAEHGGGAHARSKVSMKELFARPKLMKSGKPSASLRELPPIHEIQTAVDPVTRWMWVDYSSFDAKATWDLYHSLRCRLEATDCEVDPGLRNGMCSDAHYTQWDLYRDVFRPFGELLTELEQEGFYVDAGHLQEQDRAAVLDLADAEQRFRSWLRRYSAVIGGDNDVGGIHPDAIPDLVNVSSAAQIQTLLFGGFVSAKQVVKEPTKAEAAEGAVAGKVRLVKANNPLYGEDDPESGAKAKRYLEFKLTCIFGREGTRLKSTDITMLTAAQGLPMTSAAALRALCGKPGAAKKALKAIDRDNVHGERAEAAEALGDAESRILLAPTNGGGQEDIDDEGIPDLSTNGNQRRLSMNEREVLQRELGLGSLYLAFDDHKAGLEACAAVEALIEISAIETLRSSFLLPLQGNAVKAEVRSVRDTDLLG